MLIGQVVLYIVTALPFVINMAYTTATQYVPPASKSRYRLAAEYLSLTATGSFGTYLFNAVSYRKLFDFYSHIFFDSYHFMYIH